MTPPTATYRLQLSASFGFRAAAAVVPYLAELGVSHVYLSPILEAAPGSPHGYDVVDHDRLSGERGGLDGWQVLQSALREHGLGCVVDIVPNHMAIPVPQSRNGALWSVLADGPQATTANWFDIDWAAGGGRLVLPFLGCDLDEALRSGQLTRDGDLLRYHDHEFPVAPETAHLGWPDVVHAQHYLLTYWADVERPLNYRRFFDVDDLIALRVEDPDVFAQTHRLLLELVRRGDIQGLRIDHVDGLADPGGYLRTLAEAAGDTWVVVEKILAVDESLPADWPCAGTTGYDALRVVDATLRDPTGLAQLGDLHGRVTGERRTYPEVVHEAKAAALGSLFAGERVRLHDLARQCLPGLDADTVGAAVDALLVAMPVYRSYLVPGRPAAATDTAVLDAARRQAARRVPTAATELAQLTALLLGCEGAAPGSAEAEFVSRFQQLSGALTAKGVEDTAGYRWHVLAAECEVGGDPGQHAHDPVAQFHRYAAGARTEGMTALSTHDSKRSEDVRARLATLTEVPAAWAQLVDELQAAGDQGVDQATRYLCWQTVLGTAPIDADRLAEYLRKAVREAKLATSWLAPAADYETAVAAYAQLMCEDGRLGARLEAFLDRELRAGWTANVLAQKVLQLTMPGVPDVYQGAEALHLALVDPDNRRTVDYGTRGKLLASVDRTNTAPTGDTDLDALKVHVTSTLLRVRRDRPDLLTGYQPLHAEGPAAGHVVAFSRGGLVTAVQRLSLTLDRAGGFGDTALTLPPGTWTDLFTGATWTGAVRLADLLAELPVAVLTR